MPLIDVGQAAPEFDLKDQFGKSHRLKDYRGRIVVLYFYPEDDTPLCTQQACQFRDHHGDFTKIKGVILGVSPQGQASKKVFVEKHALPFTLLADEVQTPAGPKVCVAYGAWGDKNMYGKIVRSMLRTTYVIDGAGRVAARFDRVKTPGHALKVLAVVRALHAGEAPEKAKAAKRTHPKKTTRTQGGHAGYSGVVKTKGTRTPNRAKVAKGRIVKSKGKVGVSGRV